MVLPSLPTCPANFVLSKTVILVEAPHALVVRPLRVPGTLGAFSARAVAQLLSQPSAATALVSAPDAAVDSKILTLQSLHRRVQVVSWISSAGAPSVY